jgi:hypothetical protein
MAHKLLNAVPRGVGNVLSSLYQKAAPIAKTILKDTLQKSLSHGVQGILRHNQIGDAGHSATSSPSRLVKKKKRKSTSKKGGKSKGNKPHVVKKQRKKAVKKGTSLPDVF